MGLSAIYNHGELVNANNKNTNISSMTNSSLDKEAFLQLLVAEMKYQDPMEPTSNTEYISQFATFSELEEMQNVSQSSELSRASSMVGQTVIVNAEDASGNVKQITGKVDYVVYENSKAYLSINESLYSLDDVYAVADDAYLEAMDMASALVNDISKLPALTNVTMDHKETILALRDRYEAMNDYQKSFVASAVKTTLDQYIAKIEELNGAKA